MHYGVGGNSKYWGSVLYRLRREDFLQMEHADGISPAWPIDYETLAPYYDAAERLYSVHGQAGIDPTEPPRAPYPHAPVPHAPRMRNWSNCSAREACIRRPCRWASANHSAQKIVVGVRISRSVYVWHVGSQLAPVAVQSRPSRSW